MMNCLTRIILIIGVGLSCVGSVQGQRAEWVQQVGTEGFDQVFDVSLDSQQNVYATGYTSLATDSIDVFVAKYNAVGNQLWERKASAKSYSSGRTVEADSAGNVYVSGYFSGSIRFGTVQLGNGNTHGGFLAKYNSRGDLEWAKQVEDAFAVYGLSLGKNGDVYVCGQSRFTASAMLVKYDAQGNFKWHRDLSRNAQGEGTSYAIAANDTVVWVAGEFNGEIGSGNSIATSRGLKDIFLACYDAQGNSQWTRRAGGDADFEQAQSIVIGSDGSAYIAGVVGNNASFGSQNVTTAGSIEAFVAKYTRQGIVSWVRTVRSSIGNSTASGFNTLAIDADNFILHGGEFNKTAYWGTDSVTSVEGAMFIERFSSRGDAISYAVIGDGARFIASGLAVSAFNHFYVGGSFYLGPVDVAGIPLVGRGQEDGFLARLSNRVLSTRVKTNSTSLSVYPNPASARQPLHIELSATTKGTVRLLNTLGQVVRTQPLAVGKAAMSITGLATGRYVVQVQTATEVLTRGVVIE